MEQTLDITAEHCPMTMVKVKLALASLAAGDILAVTLTSGEPLDNVPRTAREQGHRVLDVEPAGDHFQVRIQKG